MLSPGINLLLEIGRVIINTGHDALVGVVHEHLALEAVILNRLGVVLGVNDLREAVVEIVVVMGGPGLERPRCGAIVVQMGDLIGLDVTPEAVVIP